MKLTQCDWWWRSARICSLSLKMLIFHCLFTVNSFTVLAFKHLSAYYQVASYLYSPEHMLCPKSCEEPHSTNMRQVVYQNVDT
jgi:hypothetical protein